MINRKIALGIVALVVVVVGATAMIPNGDNVSTDRPQFITLSESVATNKMPDRPETRTPKLGPSGISHATPPPLEALRDYSHAQSLYDQEAKPGDFVTPPAVSVEH